MNINDIRSQKDFAIQTFCGYRKLDVFKALFSSIESHKVEEVCYWIVELILSGFTSQLFDKFIIYSCKYINIINPKLFKLLLKRYSYWKNLKSDSLSIRTNPSIYNYLIEIGLLLTLSGKLKYKSLPKITSKDFEQENFLKKLKAKDQKIIKSYSQKNDPCEVNIIVNELWWNIKNHNVEGALYFFNMLYMLDKKKNIKCHERACDYISKKYYSDFTMYLWFIFINESIHINKKLNDLINTLFEISCYQYSKTKTCHFLITSIKFLSNPHIDYNKQICNQRYTIIQATSKVNYIIKEKKAFEITQQKQTIDFSEPKKKKIDNSLSDKEKIVMSLDVI